MKGQLSPGEEGKENISSEKMAMYNTGRICKYKMAMYNMGYKGAFFFGQATLFTNLHVDVFGLGDHSPHTLPEPCWSWDASEFVTIG